MQQNKNEKNLITQMQLIKGKSDRFHLLPAQAHELLKAELLPSATSLQSNLISDNPPHPFAHFYLFCAHLAVSQSDEPKMGIKPSEQPLLTATGSVTSTGVFSGAFSGALGVSAGGTVFSVTGSSPVRAAQRPHSHSQKPFIKPASHLPKSFYYKQVNCSPVGGKSLQGQQRSQVHSQNPNIKSASHLPKAFYSAQVYYFSFFPALGGSSLQGQLDTVGFEEALPEAIATAPPLLMFTSAEEDTS